jgi:hypothetical protein
VQTQKKGILPVKTPLFFKQANIPAAKTKLAQLNDEFKASSVSHPGKIRETN